MTSLLSDLDKFAPQSDAGHYRPSVTFELGRTRHDIFLIIADYIYNCIGAQLFGAFFELNHGREKHPIARPFIGFADGIGLLIGYIRAQFGENFWSLLIAEKEFNRAVKFILRIFNCQGWLDG